MKSELIEEYAYAISGHGPPLLLLPGLFAGDWIWADARVFLERHYQAISLSPPFAKLSMVDPSVSGLVGYVTRFVQELRLPSVVLIGNSLGALVAMGVAAEVPEVKGLVLSGAPAKAEHEMSLPRVTRGFTENDKSVILANLFHDRRFLDDSRVKAAYDLLQDREAIRFIIRSLRSARQEQAALVLPKIQCPILFIWGQHDIVSPFTHWQEHLPPAFPAERIVFLDECGHSPMIEKPKEFASHVLRFLACIGF